MLMMRNRGAAIDPLESGQTRLDAIYFRLHRRNVTHDTSVPDTGHQGRGPRRSTER
jgi:hypothetical protein